MTEFGFVKGKGYKIGDQHRSISNARQYLSKFGYVQPNEAAVMTKGLDVLDRGLTNAIKRFQEFYGLESSGVLDSETREWMSKPRCGIPDIDPFEPKEGGIAGEYKISGGKWSSLSISYKFINGTVDLAGGKEREIFKRALKTWADEIPFQFTEVKGSSAAIMNVLWAKGHHGDDNAFDGPGKVLAHAFYPPPVNGSSIAGDVHFDDDTKWGTSHGSGKTDLLTVAIHEIGHALGIKHSDVKSAIMFPTYSGENRRLDYDDVAAIKKIYGKPDQSNLWQILRMILEWLLGN